ncbi:hypothetical protein C7T94_12325 [Pedobacter yulinensis]|uniref:Uncharacterized protein n=2 Tax=Pedobacter yulinensis TaxID=2126353 RepID=A0A2T3HLP0_9SPHI|nr:hypothetical protein C7T94_12325 [Pedobacter yulinensis]
MIFVLLFSCGDHKAGGYAAGADTDTSGAAAVQQPELAGAIEQGEFTFLHLDQDGDDDLLLLVGEGDTLDMICSQVDMPQLYRGDRVSVQWNNKRYVPAGDAQAVSVRPFVASLRVLASGRLGKRMKQQPIELKLTEKDSTLSDWGTEQIKNALLFYLANIKDPVVRRVADATTTQPIGFSAKKTEINGEPVYEVGLSAPGHPEPYFKVVYYLPEHKFDIWEYGQLDPADGSSNKADRQ